MKKKILENVLSLAIALFLVLIIRSSVIEAYKIPSGSMIPTLLVGDHIFVNKFAYGLKVPIVEWLVDDPVYIFRRNGPSRGDIIVFKYPKDESLYYIKRVVGLPGDSVDWKNKQLWINDERVTREPIGLDRARAIFEKIDSEKYGLESLEIYDENIALGSDRREHLMMLDSNNYLSLSRGPWKVPPGMYFVMGDNRDHSNDSRFWGFVPEKNIKGRAMVIWLSLWLDFSDWSQSAFKPSRIGTILK